MATPMGTPFEKKVLDENWSATIKVRGNKHCKIANGNGYFDDPTVMMETGVTAIEINATSLEALQRKINGHVALIEDDMKEIS